MSNEEIRTQIEVLINEYVLKLNALETQLNDKNEDLRLLRKSFAVLDAQLAPAEQSIHELTARCQTYENTIRELEEQITDLNQSSGLANARLIKLEHKNTSKFYAVILLCVISVIALFFAFNNNANVLNKIESSLSGKLSSSAAKQASKPMKQRKKHKTSATVASTDDSLDSDTQNVSHADATPEVEKATVKKEATMDQSSAGIAN